MPDMNAAQEQALRAQLDFHVNRVGELATQIRGLDGELKRLNREVVGHKLTTSAILVSLGEEHRDDG